MTVSSNLVAATIDEHPEQSVTLEVKRVQGAKSNRSKSRRKEAKPMKK